MKNASYSGRVFHSFKRRESYMIDQIDRTRKEKQEKEELKLGHKEVNEKGRLWTF